MARLAALFSDGRPGPKVGPLTVKANVKGNMTAVDVAATTGMNGGSLKIAARSMHWRQRHGWISASI